MFNEFKVEFVCLFKDSVTRILIHTIIVIIRNRYISTIVEIQSQIHVFPEVIFYYVTVHKKKCAMDTL